LTSFDPRALRDAFGSFMTGVTVVTTRAADGTPVGFTANSFASVSLDPPMVLVCPGKFLSTYEAFTGSSHFAISVLAEGQRDVSNIFAGSKEDRFAQVPHSLDLNDVPVIDGALARFSCRTHQVIPAGDHSILMGEVQDFTQSEGLGLGYVAGRYFSLGLEHSSAQSVQQPVTCGAIIECDGGVLLERTEKGYRPLQVSVAEAGNLRDSISASLAAQGVEAELNQVYSSYTDANTGAKFTYFLGSGATTRDLPGGELIPTADLPGITFTRQSITNMMARFAYEVRTRNFSLYLGDTNKGDIHRITQRT
jgi:flavin reductase (DIM6/NTAB) family NADH-FMN oxidoreductase RutF